MLPLRHNPPHHGNTLEQKRDGQTHGIRNERHDGPPEEETAVHPCDQQRVPEEDHVHEVHAKAAARHSREDLGPPLGREHPLPPHLLDKDKDGNGEQHPGEVRIAPERLDHRACAERQDHGRDIAKDKPKDAKSVDGGPLPLRKLSPREKVSQHRIHEIAREQRELQGTVELDSHKLEQAWENRNRDKGDANRIPQDAIMLAVPKVRQHWHCQIDGKQRNEEPIHVDYLRVHNEIHERARPHGRLHLTRGHLPYQRKKAPGQEGDERPRRTLEQELARRVALAIGHKRGARQHEEDGHGPVEQALGNKRLQPLRRGRIGVRKPVEVQEEHCQACCDVEHVVVEDSTSRQNAAPLRTEFA